MTPLTYCEEGDIIFAPGWTTGNPPYHGVIIDRGVFDSGYEWVEVAWVQSRWERWRDRLLRRDGCERRSLEQLYRESCGIVEASELAEAYRQAEAIYEERRCRGEFR